MLKHPFVPTYLTLLSAFSVITTQVTTAEIEIKAEVVSSDSSFSTLRFTFSGDLAGLSPQVNLRCFLFIDFSESPALSASLPGNSNLTQFAGNSVSTNTSSTITTVEVRNNEIGYYDRIGFVFNSAFTPESTMDSGSILEVVIPTTTPITSADFNELPVYWCFPNWGVNQGRGTLAGVVNPVEQAVSIDLFRDSLGRPVINFTGVLESSPDLNSPFSPVVGATSPYLIPIGPESRYFFRATRN